MEQKLLRFWITEKQVMADKISPWPTAWLEAILFGMVKEVQWCHGQCHDYCDGESNDNIVQHDQKCYVVCHFNLHDLRSQWCHWQCHQHHMMPKPIASYDKKACCTSFWLSWPKESNGPIDDTTSFMWHWFQKQFCHMIKIVILHFSCLGLRNGMVPMIIPLASHDPNASSA